MAQALLQKIYQTGRQELEAYPTLNHQLKEMVESYLDKNPYLTMNAFAKKSGVGATTLRRVVGLVTKSEPAPHTILNIVSYIHKEKKLSRLLTVVDGPIGETLNRCFASFTEEDKYTFSNDLNHYLKDKDNYLIYKLSANRRGTTRIEIVELLGQLGNEKLNALIDLELLEEIEGEVHAKEKNFSLDIGIAKKHLPEVVKFYKPEELDRGQNIFYNLSETVNEEAIVQIKKIQKDAVQKIYAIMTDVSYEGDIPYFALNLADTMTMKTKSGEIQ
jgi:hypothetical protein